MSDHTSALLLRRWATGGSLVRKGKWKILRFPQESSEYPYKTGRLEWDVTRAWNPLWVLSIPTMRIEHIAQLYLDIDMIQWYKMRLNIYIYISKYFTSIFIEKNLFFSYIYIYIKNEILHFAIDFNGVWFVCKVQYIKYIKYIKSMKASKKIWRKNSIY